VQHQVLADQTGGIREAVGKAARSRIEQQTRRADAVCGEDHYFGRLESLYARRVIINDAGRHSLFVGGDLPHPAARAQLDPVAKRVRPIGDVDARLRTLSTARRAVVQIYALGTPVIFGRGDGDVRRPPMPAQPVHRLRIARTGLS